MGNLHIRGKRRLDGATHRFPVIWGRLSIVVAYHHYVSSRLCPFCIVTAFHGASAQHAAVEKPVLARTLLWLTLTKSPPDAVLLSLLLVVVVAASAPTNPIKRNKQASERLHEPILLPLRYRRAELPAVRAQGVLRPLRRRSPILQGKTT